MTLVREAMDAKTFSDWSSLFAMGVGLYSIHHSNLSTRILRRRISGLTETEAVIVLAVVTALAELGAFREKDVPSVLDDQAFDDRKERLA